MEIEKTLEQAQDEKAVANRPNGYSKPFSSIIEDTTSLLQAAKSRAHEADEKRSLEYLATAIARLEAAQTEVKANFKGMAIQAQANKEAETANLKKKVAALKAAGLSKDDILALLD